MKTRDPYLQIARVILGALGGAGSVLAACGGSAVVDREGSGGASSAATSVQASSTSSTQPFVCNVTPPPAASLEYACVAPWANGCLPKDDPGVEQALGEQLEWEDCGSDPGCCTSAWITSVPCGPDPGVDDACCYYALVETGTACMGRPFWVGDEVRVAEEAERDDWLVSLKPSLAGTTPAERQALAEAWLSDALDEHASIAAFARFVLQLLTLGAPAALVRSAERALADEIVHARLCFGLASAYAGRRLGPGPLDIAGALEGDASPEALVRAVVREGCVGETLSATMASVALTRCEDPAVAAVLARIARDESRHAALAWRFVRWLVERDPRLRAPAAAELSAALASFPRSAETVAEVGPWARAGRLSPEERVQVAYQTARRVIGPAAELVLASGELAGAPAARGV